MVLRKAFFGVKPVYNLTYLHVKGERSEGVAFTLDGQVRSYRLDLSGKCDVG